MNTIYRILAYAGLGAGATGVFMGLSQQFDIVMMLIAIFFLLESQKL